MGVLLFTLVVGHLPFDATDLRELRTKILTVRYNLGRGEVSNDLLALLKKMLVLDPRDRYSLRVKPKFCLFTYPHSLFLRFQVFA